MLHRAFAKPGIPVPPPSDPAAALEIARRFHLAGRIGARTPPDLLKAEIDSLANEIAIAVETNAANCLRYELTLRQVAGLAASRGIPLVILKGSALGLLGITAPGARSFGDLDILIPADRIPELRTVLLAAGWTSPFLDGAEHHGSPLAHPSLGLLELHGYMPGVRRPGSSRFLNARTLLDAGLTDAITGFPSAVRVPARVVLIAHAIVHALHQHAYYPPSYPLFRFLADLQDIGADAEALADAGRYLRDLDSGDLTAVAELACALESGTAHDLPVGAPRSLLGHLVAGNLDATYIARLGARRPLLPIISALPRWLVALRKAYKSTFLSRAWIDASYGPPKHWLGYAARRLIRPFDLAVRLGRRLSARVRR